MIIDKNGISIRPASGKDRALIRNIFNMYQNELSVYSDDFVYLDENGYFAAETVNEILPFGDGVYPYILTHDLKPIGFVMITDRRYAPNGADFCVEDLFLVRPFRGTGAAQTAVRQLFKAHPGVWSLEVYEENRRARTFWTHLISEYDKQAEEKAVSGGLVRMKFVIRAENE